MRRRLPWIILSIAVLIGVGLSILGFMLRSANSQWAAFEADMRAAGSPLTFKEIKAARPVIRDEDNGAHLLELAFAELERIGYVDPSDVFIFGNGCEDNLSKGISKHCIEPTRRYIEAHASALKHLDALHSFSELRIGYSDAQPSIGPMTEQLDILSSIRRISKLAVAQVILNAVDNDKESAIANIRLVIRLAGALREEPSLIAHLVAIAVDALATESLSDILRCGEIDRELLQMLQDDWQRQLSKSAMYWVFLGERAYHINMTDRSWLAAQMKALMAKQGMPTPKPNPWRVPNPLDWIPFVDDLFLVRGRLAGAKVYMEFIKASHDVQKLRAVATRWQTAPPPRGLFGTMLINISLPSLTRSVEQHVRSLSLSRCVPAALAAERYRMDVGHFPPTLDALIPKYLAEVPRDPYDGAPLRYALRDDGAVIYSIGENGLDDGGDITRTPAFRFGRDFGFRLWTTEHRRVPLIDTASTDE